LCLNTYLFVHGEREAEERVKERVKGTMKVVTGKERQKLIYQLGEVINTKQFLKHTESEMNVEQSNESHEKSF
jgi:hypothetical protein